MTNSDSEDRLRALSRHPSVSVVGIALLAVLLVSISFSLQAHLFINIADEGFLWYGTWRTSLGEVPIRDFQSYDPGRYYWGAFWSQFLGDGIIALRASSAIFQCVGLTFGLLVLRRLNHRLDFLFVSGFVLLVWMYPRHKLFDISIAMALTYATVRLIERPSLGMHFAAGLFVGIAAFFGLNHGLYGCVALGLAILFTSLTQEGPHWVRRVLRWSAGILVGYSPMLLMAFLIPDFFDSLVERIMLLMERGATNVSQPIPWPWTIWTAPPPYLEALRLGQLVGFVVGILYLIWFTFLGAVGLHMLRNREPLTKARGVLFAAALVSLPYLHHATARAGITHLAQAIHPLLIGLFAAAYVLARNGRRYVVPATAIALLLISAGSIVMLNPVLKRYTPGKMIINEWALIGKDKILIQEYMALAFQAASSISRSYMTPEDRVFIAPRLAAYYPIMQRKAPVREIYFTVAESPERQEEIREELESKNVQWAIIGDEILDANENLRFRKTHSHLWKYFERNFEPIEVAGILEHHTVLRKRESSLDPMTSTPQRLSDE